MENQEGYMKKSIKRSFALIQKTYTMLRREKKSIRGGTTAEWLCDNFYIFAQEYTALRRLRTTSRHTKKAAARMYLWASGYLAGQEYRLEEWALSEAMRAEQSSTPFSTEELRILPAALSAALFSRAASLCSRPQAEENMGTVVKSLLALRELDIKALFERHSAVDAAFSSDRAFSAMTFASKVQYRRAVARFAVRCGKSEAFVAEQVTTLTRGKKGKQAHVGYYLIGEGEPLLRRALSLPEKKRKHLTALYLFGVFSLTAVFLWSFYSLTGHLIWLILAILPAMDIAVQILQYCLLRATPVRHLPRLELSEGIPEKILVVYPTLLSSPKKAAEMAEKLEICYLANREEALRFAVLGDFRDSAERMEDPEIITACADAIDTLNKKYGNRFYMLCRGQEYAPRQKKWMGRERKRGALCDLNAFLRDRYTFRYTAGVVKELTGIRYVLTLDDDTLLPPGAARSLAGIALHPMHAPIIQNGRVTEGYGLIQPRVSLRLESAGRTFFSRIFAGQGGIDTYQSSVSEFYMDVFGESVFTGKGLYHVDTFLRCLSFPPDTVLSHDLLEGSYVRCGLASDVQVFDSFPHRLADHSTRQHRWIRGDWQTVPWLFSRVRDSAGKKVKNPISALSRWKIFDNLRRSLTPFFTLLLLISGGGIPALVAFLALMLPIFFTILDSAFQKNFFHLGEKMTANIIYGVRSALYQATLSIAFLAHTAFTSLSAALTGLWRSFTHRRTLQWVTAADAEKGRRHTLPASFRFMMPSVLLGLFLVLSCLSGAFPSGGIQLLLAVIWIFAPALAYIAGLEPEPDVYTLPPKGEAMLRETAERIWHFFRDYMTEEDHFLPPDNVQVKPYRGAAHRTSPTNIGLGILACLCANDLGFISDAEMEDRISKTMDTLESLPTWHGHLYNWYDTRTLRPLPPRYISTVDSGNLACYLLTAAMGIQEQKGADAPLAARLLRFAENTDFRPLYNAKKKLFSIGFSLEENRLTDSYYDLLISEARQAGFLAIALGQIPPEHWFSLGRGLVAADGYRGLVSWSGTMFEYFMPLLLMKSYDNSLLSETYRFAIRCQKRYGKRRRVPWGVSESGFYAFDNEGNYQYNAFGVPELRLCRRDNEDVVITPYATLLSLMEDPKGAIANMQIMRRDGLYGEYGFFEAADYTRTRLGGNMRRGIVKSYMAHHQGMSLAAITNLLCKNSLQRRFHSHAAIRAAEPLLKERVPVHAAVMQDIHERVEPVRFRWQTSVQSERIYQREETCPRPVQLLSNGNYHVHIDTAGEGRSSLDGVQFNSFPPLLGGGQSIKIINTVSGEIIDGYGSECIFTGNSAEFRGEGNVLSTRLSVTVCAEENAEIRRLTLINQGKKRRVFEVYYYTVPSLTSAAAENAHPAFSKLFITTGEKDGVLYASRQKRSSDEKTFVGFAAAVCEGEMEGGLQFDTDRLSFFGRNTDIPKTVSSGSIPSGKTGTVLDPCFALKLRIALEPGTSGSVTFLAGLAESEKKADEIVQRYKNSDPSHMPAATRDPALIFKEGEEARFLHAAAFMIRGGARVPQIAEARTRNLLPLQEIWKLGISGDFPILTLRLTTLEDEPLLEEALKAVQFWKTCGLRADLAVFCDEPGGYTRPLFQMAEKRKSGSVFIFGRRELCSADYDLLLAASTLYLDAASGGFGALPPFTPLPAEKSPSKKPEDGTLPPIPLLFDNGRGGFCKETGEYIISMTRAGQTPLPWVHVVANAGFGFIAGESGSGYTWSENSHAFRLTPWFCDPVRDPLSERLTISEATDIWSPMAATFPEEGVYRTRYGAGYVIYERSTRQILHTVTLFSPPDKAQKIIQVCLSNLSEEKRTLTAEYSAAAVLGTLPHPDRITVLETGGCVRVRNALTNAAREVYLTASGECHCTARGHLISAKSELSLKKGETKTIVFILGEGKPEMTDAALALRETKAYWDQLLSTLSVETGDAAADLMLNRWLPYQATACRLFARTAFYQSGGAFGFRDQLQDSLALIDLAPALVKNQIMLHAAHQFSEGDVFHWWHTDERGVRTRFSDDRLFLPYVACLYAKETGDDSIWDMTAPFVEEPPLRENEEERYTFVKGHTNPYSLYEHCIRAIEISLPAGAHGLPLMGGGDWNDGMNAVGIGGKGESVWLGWFLKSVLDMFIPVAEKKGDTKRAARYRREALRLLEAIETEAWDGTHYARAFFDDGTPLGTSACAECSIDAISQAWAVIAGGARPMRQKTAMDSVYRLLVDRENELLRLLAPPFTSTIPSPGYIQSYPAGLRENGGQYTHGAIWAIIAFALSGEKEKARELFRMLNPISHTETPGEVSRYKTEPYVLAADVYTAPGHEGRGGWTWYTGAAAWMYRLGIRYMVGFQHEGDKVSFHPCLTIPEKGITVKYRYKNTPHTFHVYGDGENIQLFDDGELHEITIR